jgi:tripartite-type tricarboxylate transporter receptor subunit TctC
MPNPVNRRSLLDAATATALAVLLPAGASAQTTWPNRPIKLIDAYAPGGSTDTLARMIGSKLSARLGQPIVVENRSGAGGALGTDSVAKSPPDGYTLLLTSTAMPTNAASGKKLPYDFLKDLAPIGLIATTPLLIVVPADSRIKTLRDLVDLARAKPGDGVRYGSSGVGSMSHIGMELLASVAQVQFLHVPYKGVSMSVTDLLGGQLQALLGTVATHVQMLEAGRMRGLVVTSPQRSPFLPNVPTSIEAGFPGFQIEFWFGLMCPAGVPPEVIRRLNTELNVILGQADVRELLARFAAIPKPSTPEEFGRLNAFEVGRWSKLIKDANIKME